MRPKLVRLLLTSLPNAKQDPHVAKMRMSQR
jgi:hypothetical protein